MQTDTNSTVVEFRVKEATTRLQYILRVFNLNESSQDTYRVYDRNGSRYIGDLLLTSQGMHKSYNQNGSIGEIRSNKTQKGCSQVPFIFNELFTLFLHNVQLCTLFSFLIICVFIQDYYEIDS